MVLILARTRQAHEPPRRVRHAILRRTPGRATHRETPISTSSGAWGVVRHVNEANAIRGRTRFRDAPPGEPQTGPITRSRLRYTNAQTAESEVGRSTGSSRRYNDSRQDEPEAGPSSSRRYNDSRQGEPEAGPSSTRALRPTDPEVSSDDASQRLGRLVADDPETGLKVYVVRTEVRRELEYRFQNHLYRFHIVKPPGYRYSVESLSRTLQAALAGTIRMVQRGYRESTEEYAQLFVVLRDRGNVKKGAETGQQSGDAHSFNSGHYQLWQDAKAMAKEILEKVTMYFQSNKEFSLGHGLYFSMTVVHYRYELRRQRNARRYRAPRQAVGAPRRKASTTKKKDNKKKRKDRKSVV